MSYGRGKISKKKENKLLTHQRTLKVFSLRVLFTSLLVYRVKSGKEKG